MRFLLYLLVSSAAAVAEESYHRLNTAAAPLLQRRNQEDYGCNTVVETIQANAIQEFLTSAIDDLYTSETSPESSFLKDLISASANHGVQVYKVCASCEEFDVDSVDYQRYCGNSSYGFDTMFSGLAVLPWDGDSVVDQEILPGLLYAHDSTVNQVPSVGFVDGSPTTRDVLQYGLIPASMGVVTVLPDYFGFGVSNANVSKGYLIRQSYETSMIPLWHKVAALVPQESNCSTVLAKQVTVMGYGEGGYAATSAAQALHELGWEISRLYTGAVPSRTGGIGFPSMIESIDKKEFPDDMRFTLMFLASAYSSTYADVDNFNQGQDMLRSSARSEVVSIVSDAVSEDAFNSYLGVQWTKMFSVGILAWIRQQYATDPSLTCQGFMTGFNDQLCLSLLENDLTTLMEGAEYQSFLCHSYENRLYSIDHLPNTTMNDNATVMLLNGTHVEAAFPCIAERGLAYLASSDFTSLDLKPRSASECSSPAPTTTTAQDLTPPTEQDLTTSSPPSPAPTIAALPPASSPTTMTAPSQIPTTSLPTQTPPTQALAPKTAPPTPLPTSGAAAAWIMGTITTSLTLYLLW